MSDYFSLSPTNPLLWGAALLVLGGLALWAFGLSRVLTGLGGGVTGAKLKRSVSLAIKSLWLHKLRSFLSVLGIIIGIASVIALMAFGEGSMQDALDDIKRQGATNIIVRSVKPPDDSIANTTFISTYGIVRKDLDRISTLGDAIVRVVPLRVFPSQARYRERVLDARVIGTTPDYAEVHKFDLAGGRFLIDADGKDRVNY